MIKLKTCKNTKNKNKQGKSTVCKSEYNLLLSIKKKTLVIPITNQIKLSKIIPS